MSPSRGDRRPKKRNDQSTLRKNCTPKIPSAICTSRFSVPHCQTRYSAVPMRMKSVIHTGANTQLGGAKNGFCRDAYQEPGPLVVTSEPRLPRMRQERIAAISFGYDWIVIVPEDSIGFLIVPRY